MPTARVAADAGTGDRTTSPGDQHSYAYLLGLYLGDGWLTRHARDVHQLHIAHDERYPGIIKSCAEAISAVNPASRVAVRRNHDEHCMVVSAYSKAWPCLFPQHGPGLKHNRPIVLADWQKAIADEHPEQLLRGLIHSDGCRSRNVVNGKNYPRYIFCNHSDDIHDIFKRYRDLLTSNGAR